MYLSSCTFNSAQSLGQNSVPPSGDVEMPEVSAIETPSIVTEKDGEGQLTTRDIASMALLQVTSKSVEQ